MLHKIKFFTTLLITFFTVVQVGIAQSDSYILLNDPSGIAPSTIEVSELEKAADSLVAAFPLAFRDSFKVIEGAIYPIMAYINEGVEESLGKIRAEAAIRSDFYLLIIRKYDSAGNQSLIAELKLPVNACFTSSKISILKYNLSRFISENIDGINKIIKHTETLIENITNCCGSEDAECSPEKDIIDFLKSKDFVELGDNLYSISSTQSNIPYIGLSHIIYYQRGGVTVDLTDEMSSFAEEMSQYGTIELKVKVLKTALEMEGFQTDYVPIDTTGKYYTDEIILVQTPDGYKCYGKFHHSFENNTLTIRGENIQSRALPLIVVWVLKRAAMAGIGVFAHVAISVAIEKYIGGLDTWEEAWNNTSFTTAELTTAAFNGATADRMWISILGTALIGTVNDIIKIPSDQLTWSTIFGVGFDNALVATITTIGTKFVSKAGTALVKYIGKGGGKYLRINRLFLKSSELRNSIYGDKLLKALQKVAPNTNNYITSASITSYAKKVPMYSKEMAALMNQLKNATNTQSKGEIAEKICERYFKDCGYNVFIKKLNNSGHGLDMIVYKGTLTNPKDVIIIEAKKIVEANGIKLNPPNKTSGLPSQMSIEWIRRGINGLFDITTGSEKKFIEYCGINHQKLSRMVVGVSDVSEELILVNLLNYL